MVAVDRTTLLTAAEARWAVGQAVRAPSIHNTQPWRFRWDGHTFDLNADTSRGLTVSDPDSRELAISCGAALFNLRLALRKMGFRPVVDALPDRHNPRLLARVTPTPGSPASVEERLLFAALSRRHTHRGEFNDGPIGADLLVRLQHAAENEGAVLLYVSDPGSRLRILHLARAAERALMADERVREEIEQWTPPPTSDRRDGVPAGAYPSGEQTIGPDELAPRDFDLGRDRGKLASTHQAPGAIAVLATHGDLLDDWFRAGQALECVLVTAAQAWVFAALHSQLIEMHNLRDELRRELSTAYHPQLVMRFGGASQAPTTPRRPVDDVIELPE